MLHSKTSGRLVLHSLHIKTIPKGMLSVTLKTSRGFCVLRENHWENLCIFSFLFFFWLENWSFALQLHAEVEIFPQDHPLYSGFL